MSGWRRHAVAEFPEFRTEIQAADSAHGVFYVLLPALHDAYRAEPADEQLLERIYRFAEWCRAPDRHDDVRGAALVSFYEHLPEFGPAWRDLPRRVPAERLAELRRHLRGYLSPTAYAEAIRALDSATALWSGARAS